MIKSAEEATARLRAHIDAAVGRVQEAFKEALPVFLAFDEDASADQLDVYPPETDDPNGDPADPREFGRSSWGDFQRICDALGDTDLDAWRAAVERLAAAARAYELTVWVTQRAIALGWDTSDREFCVLVTDPVGALDALNEHRRALLAETDVPFLAGVLAAAGCGGEYTQALWDADR